MATRVPDEEVLSGGGETGALMRTVDWASTPLGSVRDWPQSLRTAVSILLDSRFPMYIAWGSQYVQLYNDGYRPILGSTKHPAAMGNRASQTFAESWHIIGPMFDDVMRGKATGAENWMLPLDRHGYLEECFFTFSYSPIRDESGGPGGVHVTVSETTERVIHQRRLALLHELSERTSQATTPEEACWTAGAVMDGDKEDVPFALLYLLSEDRRAARLSASCGLANRPQLRPQEVSLHPSGDPSSPWPLWRVVENLAQEHLTAIPAAFGQLPGGVWPEPTRGVILHPIMRPGHSQPYGVLVAGVSPRRGVDKNYRDFFTLIAGHVATAITNARALADERRRREQLAEIDRAKTAFFSNVSHEFRTPLTLLLGPAEDALGAPSLAPEERTRWTLVHRNALRLSKLVNTLLDFSRLEAGRVEASFEPTDLVALTSELASMFRSALERAGLELELALDEGLKAQPVYVDREMWEKIVFNLLSNALKYTFRGRVTVELRPGEGGVQLSVTDTGTGIPKSQLPFIFDRFHRVKGAKARSQEGTGIGLALVQELTKLHGGRVEVESTEGLGTRFSVILPLGKDHLPPERIQAAKTLASTAQGAAPFVQEALRWLPGSDDEAASATAAVPADTGRPRARILLADDNADMREYVARLLRERWDVETVPDGLSALAAIRARPPDLILTDVMMPGLDGMGLLRRLREDPATRSIPVVLLSARAGEEATAEALKAGANDYLVKPFAARDLLVRVASQLATARMAEERREVAELERERLYRHFMQAPFPIAIVRGPGHAFELANSQALKVWGKSPDILGKPLLEAFPELVGQPFVGYLDDVLRTGVAYEGKEELARLARGPNKQLEDVYFNFVYSPLRTAAGEVEGILVCGFEVTTQVLSRREVEKLAGQERVARAAAESADRRKDEFLAMLSHELRNPLAAIDAALKGVVDVPSAEPRFNRFRDVSARQVSTLVRMVDDLLDVSRINEGKVELRRAPVDLRAILEASVHATHAVVDARKHKLEVEVGPAALPMDGDATRLEQVFCNLLLNAAKYTPPGGRISLKVATERGASGPEVVVRVRDNGQGIAPDMQERVFELFVQGGTSLARSDSGLGIGLTLVRRLVQLHGGTVAVHSEGEGRGSEFVVRLPLKEGAQAGALPAAASASPTSTQAPAAGAARPVGSRVVLVEDSEDIRDSLREFLEDCGHEVGVAADGLSGAQKVLQDLPDVAFVDVGLPGIDGYELARRVRAAAEGANVYLVALTGYGGDAGKRRAVDAGFDLHLTKPVNLDRLEEVVRNVGARAARPAAKA